MKVRILHLGISILCILAMFSCDKIPANGKLDGMWQVMSVEENGTVSDMKEKKVYWSFQLGLVQFSAYNNSHYKRMYARFKREGNELRFYDFFFDSENFTESDNNEWITPDKASELNRWGVYPEADEEQTGRVKKTYTITTLDDNTLIVSSYRESVVLRRF